MTIFLYYLAVVNIISAIVCFTDKILAIKHKQRIREKTLFLFSIVGGSVGMFFAMHLCRHKTKHKRFMIGIPIIIILQFALLTILIHKGIIFV